MAGRQPSGSPVAKPIQTECKVKPWRILERRLPGSGVTKSLPVFLCGPVAWALLQAPGGVIPAGFGIPVARRAGVDRICEGSELASLLPPVGERTCGTLIRGFDSEATVSALYPNERGVQLLPPEE